MHPVRGLLVVAGLTIATAAAGAPSGPGRLTFTGFSLVPPEGIQWVIKSDTPHPSIQALFIRDVGEERKRLSLEKRHSFVVMTTADVIPDLPYEDADKLLKRFTEDIKGGWQPGNLKLISVSISPRAADYAQGPFCVDYQLTGNDEDRISGQSGKFFVMILRGKRCLHLLHPAYVVDLSYSQRSYHGTWITAFDKEVERFFNNLEFMPMPQLWPYVAEQLENYSYALLKWITKLRPEPSRRTPNA